MAFQAGFTGAPFSLKSIRRKANPEILKQWQDLDKKRKERREDSKLRATKKTKRVAKPKDEPVKNTRQVKNIRPVKRAQTTGKGRGK